ncbi:Uncharacterised protein [Vibrio cholerae]|nr:Uncharacterised protein [Vibrio cholerae]
MLENHTYVTASRAQLWITERGEIHTIDNHLAAGRFF